MAFKNFSVLYGNGHGIVVSIENYTSFIKIIKDTKKQKKQNNLIREGFNKLAIIIFSLAVLNAAFYLIFWATWLRNNFDFDWLEVKENVILMVTCGIPIGLPMTVTIGLFIVMSNLRKLDIIVKNIYSLYTISGIDVVLTDKTGTLTQNGLKISNVYYSTKEIDVDHCHQSPDVYLGAQDGLSELLDLCDFCLDNENSTQSELDTTLFEFSRKNRPHCKKLFDEYQVVEEIKFSSTNKYHVKLIKSLDQQHIIMVRGAPDFLLHKCRYIIDENGNRIEMDESSLNSIEAKIHHWSSMGRRLICFCKVNVTNNIFSGLSINRLINWFNSECNNLTFIGMIGFINPLKPWYLKYILDLSFHI